MTADYSRLNSVSPMAQRTGTIQTLDLLSSKFPIVFKNNSSESVPAFGIMQIESVSGVPSGMAQLVTINKPSGTDGQYLINGPLVVRAGKRGRCRILSAMTIAYTGTDPALGDTVGPSSGSWLASTAGSGYVALGGAEDGVVLCRVEGGGGGGRIAILQATAAIPAASGTPRAPSLSSDYDFIKGDDPGGAQIENWSLVEITDESYLIVHEIDGDFVIVSAFC
jgi:hypothetical protein